MLEVVNNLESGDITIQLADPSRPGIIIPVDQPENQDCLLYTSALGEEVADDRMAAKGRKRDGRDKLLASRRDDHLHLRPSLDELSLIHI